MDGARPEADTTSAAVRISFDRLAGFTAEVLCAAGLEPAGAARSAELMATADARGAQGHGVFRLRQYVRRIRAGGINPLPDIRLVADHPGTALVDGDNGMGHLVMDRAAQIAIDKARQTGVGWVGVRQSNHAGPASLYAIMPVEHDMIGLYLAVGSANHMAPWGGRELLLSTNPIAIAVPATDHPPVVLDIATTVSSYGNVERAVRHGERIPTGWMIDRDGHPLTEPSKVTEGSLLPIGGYKGYGLALLFGLLAGILNGAAFGRDVVDFNTDFSSVTNTGHSMLAIDIACFADVAVFKRNVAEMCQLIHASSPIAADAEVRVPGERSAAIFADSMVNGIRIDRALCSDLSALAAELGAPPLPTAPPSLP